MKGGRPSGAFALFALLAALAALFLAPRVALNAADYALRAFSGR